MLKTPELSETSQAISKYLIENDNEPVKCIEGDIQTHYSVKKEIPDGRILKVDFHDIDNTGIEKPMPYSRLEVILKPTTPDQVGYETMEYGLTGDIIFFGKNAGTTDKNNIFSNRFSFSRNNMSTYEIKHFQEKYERVLEEVCNIFGIKLPVNLEEISF